MTIKEMLLTLGSQIREGRRKKNMTQSDLGREIGYSINGIAKIERGESDPKFSSLVKIAGALDLDLDTLMGSDKQRKIDSLLDLYTTSAVELANLKKEKE